MSKAQTQAKVKNPKPLSYYLELNYPVTLYPEPEGGYTVLIKDLPGCMSVGETVEEALANIEDARVSWIETGYESDKKEIPLPETEREYSGRFVVRMPKSLHRRLAEGAEQEGVSLNQYILSLLSQESGKIMALSSR